MDFLEELKSTFAKLQGDMAAYRKEYPVAIAVSVSPRGHELLKQKFPIQPNPARISLEPFTPLIPMSSVRVYVWSRQPEPIKVYYDKEEFKRWFEAYANPGDLMLL